MELNLADTKYAIHLILIFKEENKLFTAFKIEAPRSKLTRNLRSFFNYSCVRLPLSKLTGNALTGFKPFNLKQ